MAVDILIAEDEPSILESLDFILRRAGWTISSVSDGEAALEAGRKLQPRMLVLDVMLPRRSGFELGGTDGHTRVEAPPGRASKLCDE